MVKPVCLCLQLGEKGVTHLRCDCEWLSSLAIAEMCCIGYFAQCIAYEMVKMRSGWDISFEKVLFSRRWLLRRNLSRRCLLRRNVSRIVFWCLSRRCLSMSFDVFRCLSMPFDAFWYLLMPFAVLWCLSMFFDAFQCLLMSFVVFWCLSKRKYPVFTDLKYTTHICPTNRKQNRTSKVIQFWSLLLL